MSASIHPYAPPQTTPLAQAGPRAWLPQTPQAWLTLSGRLLVGGFVAFAVAICAAMALTAASSGMFVRVLRTGLFGVSMLLAVLGFLTAIVAIVRAALTSAPGKGWSMFLGLLSVAGNGAFALFAFAITMWSAADFRRGRQLRRFGRVLLPPVSSGDTWASLRFGALPDDARATAEQWRDNGRTEHASVAAFASLTCDLLSLGAPPALLASAQRDALDEIRHTELCFSLARALDGAAWSPGPFPDANRARPIPLGRSLALVRLATDSLVDGALHEGVSARVLAKVARRCEIPEVARMLREVARDEGRHAAHGWDVVVWCVSEGGSPLAEALEVALRALPASMASTMAPEAASGSWERFGLHGKALEEREYVAALASLRARVARLARSVRGPREIRREAC